MMNPVKRNFQIASGITSIVVGVVNICIFMFSLLLIADLAYSLGATTTTPLAGVYAILGSIVAANIVSIVMGALMCKNPKRGDIIKSYIGITVTNTAMQGATFLYCIISGSWFCVFSLIALGLLIATLCIPTKIAQENPSVAPVDNSNNTTPIAPINQEPARPVVEQQPAESEKIEKIKQLHADGVISKEEMKRLIIREIEKN